MGLRGARLPPPKTLSKISKGALPFICEGIASLLSTTLLESSCPELIILLTFTYIGKYFVRFIDFFKFGFCSWRLILVRMAFECHLAVCRFNLSGSCRFG